MKHDHGNDDGHSHAPVALLALPLTGTTAMYVSGWSAPVHQLLTGLLLARRSICAGPIRARSLSAGNRRRNASRG